VAIHGLPCYCGDEAAWSLSLSPLARFLRSGDAPVWELEGATISGALFFVVALNILFLYTFNIESGCCRATWCDDAVGIAGRRSE